MNAANHTDAHFRSLNSSFVALVDGAFKDAAQRSGPHLLCRPGCAQCCTGAFPIGPADALRLRQALTELKSSDPERAARVQQRSAASWSRLAPDFPGDPISGALDTDAASESDDFDEFANHEQCPALDPEHGTCDLYASRPQTCRVFGPPIATGGGFGICELCFQSANADEIAGAALRPPGEELSAALDRAAIAAGEQAGSTIVAFVLQSAGKS
jgi:Fe-S-cluster containining protein